MTATGWTGYTPTVLAAAFTPTGRHRKTPEVPAPRTAPVTTMARYNPRLHAERIARDIGSHAPWGGW